MKKSFRSRPWTLVSGVTALIGLALGAAFVNAREPAKTPAPSRSGEPIVAIEAAEEAQADEVSMELMEVSDREPWNELPDRSVAADVIQEVAVEVGDISVAPVPLGPAADGTLSVFVHFDPRADRAAVAGADSPVRASVRNFVNQERAWVQYEYEILPNVVNVRGLTPRAVAALSRLPGVIKVEEDSVAHTFHNDSMPLIRAYQSQLQGAGFNGVDGAGIRCCVIDTGIDSNALMYSTRIDAAAGWDFVNNDSNPEDDNGHGSHVAGTVLGGLLNADFACPDTGPESVQGVAPAATLIGVKVLNASGSGTFSNVIAGIDRCASTTLPGGQADVINLSLGGGSFSATCDSDTAAQAVNNAFNAGVVVAVAAGNDASTNAVSTPACASGAITVAAIYDENYPNCDFPNQTSFNFSVCTDTNPVVNQRCCFSNRSSMLEVAAPGCIIFSDDADVAAGNGLVGFCGTSQATPHVAGLAALLLDANPSLTPTQVRDHINNGAVDLGAAGFDNNFGWGRIDAINSLNLAAPPPCSTNADCDDSNACTTDVCSGGTCTHTSINCDDADACTTDGCNTATGCTHTTVNCDDGVACTVDTCNAASGCANTWPACGPNDGCCGPSCNSGNDPNCCQPKNASCTTNSQCCSNKCRGGKCR